MRKVGSKRIGCHSVSCVGLLLHLLACDLRGDVSNEKRRVLNESLSLCCVGLLVHLLACDMRS